MFAPALHRITHTTRSIALMLMLGLLGSTCALFMASNIPTGTAPIASVISSLDTSFLTSQVTRADRLFAAKNSEGEAVVGFTGTQASLGDTASTFQDISEDKRNSWLQSEELARTPYANQEGITDALSILFNIKDGIKYIAGTIALVCLIISGIGLVVARSDDSISKAKDGLIWSSVGLVLIFLIEVIAIGFLGGGSLSKDLSVEASRIVLLDRAADGTVTIAQDQHLAQEFMAGVSAYIGSNIREFFNTLKVFAAVCSILFMFLAGIWVVVAAGNEENITKAKATLFHLLTAFTAFIMMDALIFTVIYPAQRGQVVVNTQTGQQQIISAQEYIANPMCLRYLDQSVAQSIQSAEKSSATAVRPNLLLDPSDANQKALFDPAVCRKAGELALQNQNLILGVLRFFETIIGAISVFFIVYAGVRIVGAFGDEGIISKEKKTLLWSLAGLFVVIGAEQIILRFAFVTNYQSGESVVNIRQGFIELAGIANFLITFVSILSIVTFLIAGFMWVANFGDSGMADKSKKMIISALLGIILSISAHAAVATLISGQSTGPSSNTSPITVQLN